jgi:hypothetical protein
MGEKYVNDKRLNVLITLFVGHKWNDIPFLADSKPEGEKYITRKSLIDFCSTSQNFIQKSCTQEGLV